MRNLLLFNIEGDSIVVQDPDGGVDVLDIGHIIYLLIYY